MTRPRRAFTATTTSSIAAAARSISTAARSMSFSRKPNLEIDVRSAIEITENQRQQRKDSLTEAGRKRSVVEWTKYNEETLAVAPAAEPVAGNSRRVPLCADIRLPRGRRTDLRQLSLHDLPTELIYKIANHAGFHATLLLSETCRDLYSLLRSPSAWTQYMHPGSSDEVVENVITITTKLENFDHLVFGLWDGASDLGGAKEVFFEHRAFNEEFDFLGGISVKPGRAAVADVSFFDHQTSLPCYVQAAQVALRSGSHPPMLPSAVTPVTPTPQAELPTMDLPKNISHSCSNCAQHRTKRTMHSVFLTGIPDAPVRWSYQFPDQRRKITFVIRLWRGSLGYSCLGELPMVHINEIWVEGKRLKGKGIDFWKNIVNGG
ncbi:hypothetical protein BC832DRAFT_546756 [Gaertneriomyces semiglobifer]|nr:hypothetical protein BC832DRAFT_546756 [Gaertneriomyces semiglobifer]